MKKILLILSLILVPNFALSDTECDKSILSKLKPKCNFLGKTLGEKADKLRDYNAKNPPKKLNIGDKFKKLKEFSANNQAINQTLSTDKKKDGIPVVKKLKAFSTNNQTIDQTLSNNKKK